MDAELGFYRNRGSSLKNTHTKAKDLLVGKEGLFSIQLPALPNLPSTVGTSLTFAGLKLTFLALPCSSPETAGWLLKPCLTFSAVSSSCGGRTVSSARHGLSAPTAAVAIPTVGAEPGEARLLPRPPPALATRHRPGQCRDTGTAAPRPGQRPLASGSRRDVPLAQAPALAPLTRRFLRAGPGTAVPLPGSPQHARPSHLLLLGVLRVHVGRAEARALERAVLVAEDAEGRHGGPAGRERPGHNKGRRGCPRLRAAPGQVGAAEAGPKEYGASRVYSRGIRASPERPECCRRMTKIDGDTRVML